MRLAIVAILVALTGLVGLGLPEIGLYGYVAYALARPDALAWAEGAYPFSSFLAIATLVGSIRYVGFFPRMFGSVTVLLLLLLQVPFTVSAFMSELSTESWAKYIMFLKSFAVLMLIPVLIQSLDRLRVMFFTIALSMSIIGIKYGVIGVMGGRRFTFGHAGFMSDNNTLALALIMSLPFIWHCSQIAENRLLRYFLRGSFWSSVAAIVMTQSRGAFVSLVVIAFLLMRESPNRWRIATLFVVAGVVLFAIAGPSYIERLKTMTDRQEVEASRLQVAQTGLRVFIDHPLFGVGFGGDAYLQELRNRNEALHVAHNNYVQMLADSGLFAGLIFGAILLHSLFSLSSLTKRLDRLGSATATYPRVLRQSLIGFMIGSTFLSRVDFDYIYLVAFTTASLLLLREKILEDAEAQAEPNLEPRHMPDRDGPMPFVVPTV
jgi:probable O-glycosylation ligase (exosortase A-associated)